MKVVVLAAGRSFRLKPIPDKNLLKFLGKPLIQYQLDMLNAAGFDDFVLIAGAHNLGQLSDLARSLDYHVNVLEQKDLDEGMAGAVMTAKEAITEDDGGMLIVSANDIVEMSAYQLIKEAAEDFAFEAAMIGKKVEEYFPGGYLEVDQEQKILKVVEKPGEGNEPSDMINLVIHYFKHPQKLFEHVENANSDRDDKYEVALTKMMYEGAAIKAVPYDGSWQAVKFPWHIQKLFHYFMENAEASISDKAEIAESAQIKGKVIIEDGVRIFDNAVVQGPAYIGKNCIIANNALVRDVNMGEGCVAGYSTEIARSFLGDDVWTHSNYIGDSVIGTNVSFGAGTVTGNLRLDERNIMVDIKGEKVDSGSPKFGLITGNGVRAGVNTSFMPGVKIGSGSFVGAGIVVAQDIEEGKYVYGKTELTIKDNKAVIDEEARGKFRDGIK